jgi:hypothetical protein
MVEKDRKGERIPVDEKRSLIPVERIEKLIYLIRGQKVILDRDLASLYGVQTKQLKRAVRRNINRFPEDFMFELSQEELENLRCQIGTSSWGGTRYQPMVFTEQGVAMLSSVLNSERAIEVNITIVRVFVRLREMIGTHKELARKLSELEQHLKDHDQQIQAIFEAIRQLMSPPERPRKKIGFEVKESVAAYRKRAKKKTLSSPLAGEAG